MHGDKQWHLVPISTCIRNKQYTPMIIEETNSYFQPSPSPLPGPPAELVTPTVLQYTTIGSNQYTPPTPLNLSRSRRQIQHFYQPHTSLPVPVPIYSPPADRRIRHRLCRPAPPFPHPRPDLEAARAAPLRPTRRRCSASDRSPCASRARTRGCACCFATGGSCTGGSLDRDAPPRPRLNNGGGAPGGQKGRLRCLLR